MMMFRKQESRKKKHPVLAAMIGGAAAFGVYSMVATGKRFLNEKKQSIAKMLRRDKKALDDCVEEMQG